MKSEKALRAFAIASYLAIIIVGYGRVFYAWAGWYQIGKWIYDYQTLIAGVLALSSVYLLTEQLRLQQRHHIKTLWLSRQDEFDALDTVYAIAEFDRFGFSESEEHLVYGETWLAPITAQQLAFVERNTTPTIAGLVAGMNKSILAINELHEKQRQAGHNQFEHVITHRKALIKEASVNLKRIVQERRSYIMRSIGA